MSCELRPISKQDRRKNILFQVEQLVDNYPYLQEYITTSLEELTPQVAFSLFNQMFETISEIEAGDRPLTSSSPMSEEQMIHFLNGKQVN